MGGAVKTVWKGLPAWPLMGALGTVVLLNGLAWGLLLALRRLDAALLGIGALAYFSACATPLMPTTSLPSTMSPVSCARTAGGPSGYDSTLTLTGPASLPPG